MGALMRAHDWSNSPLGEPANWPDTLKAAIATCLNTHFPMVIWWGPQLLMFYNDAWQPILGETKHPAGLGRPGAESWPETWPIVGVQFENALKGIASWSEDLLLASDRHGFLEECYFTYSHSPMKDASGSIVGVYSVVSETTKRVLNERRAGVLRDLLDATVEATSERIGLQPFCKKLVKLLDSGNPDVPFAALYVSDSDGRARLIACEGVAVGTFPASVAMSDTNDSWKIAQALRTESDITIDVPASENLPGGTWPEPTTRIVVLPLVASKQPARHGGVLLAGLNSRLRLDDPYRNFLRLVAAQVAGAIFTIQLIQDERSEMRRAEDAEQQLRETDRRKDEFLATLAHELRSPLGAIRNAAEILFIEGGHHPGLKLSREVIDRQVHHLARLLDDLLDVSRITHNKLQLRKEQTDLSAVVQRAIETSRPLIDLRRQDLTVTLPPELVFIDADPVRLAQVFSNLLNNAATYSEPGSHIFLSCERHGSEAVVSVKDDGIGIAVEMLRHVFEMFAQAEPALGRAPTGLGIGLSLAKALVELHGGSIEACSDGPGKGSEFVVRVPIVGEKVVQETAPGAVISRRLELPSR
jgi:signal transduction histidine kinase